MAAVQQQAAVQQPVATTDRKKLRVFKIRQALLAKSPNRAKVYEYEIICDIRGPSQPRRGPNYMEYSDYFILRFGGDNVLKGLVNESAAMLPPNETPDAMGDASLEPSEEDHFLQFEANLQDRSIMITTDLFHREDQGIIDGHIIKFKIILVDQLDLNMLEKQHIELHPMSHTFEEYNRNGTPPTSTKLEWGVNPFESVPNVEAILERNQPTLQDLSMLHHDQSNIQSAGSSMMLGGGGASGAGGASSASGDGGRTRQPFFYDRNYMADLLQPNAEKLFPKPSYAGDSIMIRFYGTDLPGITALFEITTTGQAIVDKIRRFISQNHEFRSEPFNDDELDSIYLMWNNRRFGGDDKLEDWDFNRDEIQLMGINWIPPTLNQQINQDEPAYNPAGLSQIEQDVRKAMDTMYILLRNVEACLSNANHKRESNRRVRFNYPTRQTEKKLFAKDLGLFTLELADIVRNLGLALSELSNLFVRDPPLVQGTEQYTQAKLMIQNVMDAHRYLAPTCVNMARLVIPLDHHPSDDNPRPLHILPQNR